MPVDVVIPKLGMTMQEGTLVEWLRPDGAAVTVGEPLFVLETDKLNTDIEAETSGTLHHVATAGAVLSVGEVIAHILLQGDPAPASPGPPASSASPGHEAAAVADVAARTRPDGRGAGEATLSPLRSDGRILAAPNARRLGRELRVDLRDVVGSGAGGRILGRDVEAAATRSSAARPAGRSQLHASAVARRLAEALGIDLSAISAESPAYGISRRDVERYAARLIEVSRASTLMTGSEGAATASASDEPTRVPHTVMRRIIADRMHDSLQQMAQLTIGMEVRVDRLFEFRRALRKEWPKLGRPVPSVTHLVIAATARALRDHPTLNAVFGATANEVACQINIGLSVAVDDGLIVPVIRDVHRRSLADLVAETNRLVMLARDGGIGFADLEGATFCVTALGSYGVDFFTPVINPPNVAILGIGRIHKSVRVTKKNRLRPSEVMALSLTFDHRALDGAPAATFLGRVRDLLESPIVLLEASHPQID